MHSVRVPPGDDDHLDEAWEVKERIRREEGYLRQTWDFFSRSYAQQTCYLLFDGTAGDGEGAATETRGGDPGELAGFATVRDDGYLLFLGVAADHRSAGLGRRLIELIADDHPRLTCHTRESNEDALGFYRHLGFETTSRIESYYQDGDAAYYMERGTEEAPSLGDRIASALRGDGD